MTDKLLSEEEMADCCRRIHGTLIAAAVDVGDENSVMAGVEKLLGHIAALSRERDEAREALARIAGGHIDLQFDNVTDRPLWHVAFIQLQSLARDCLSRDQAEQDQTNGESDAD